MAGYTFRGLCLGIFVATQTGALGQNIPSWFQTNSVQAHEALYSRFKAGDTNLPLLRVDVFQGLPQTGFAGKDGKLWSYQCGSISNHGWSRTLGPTELALLIKVVNALPPPSKEPIPLDRQIHISGVRSNQWFHFVYDIQAFPREVEEICKTFGSPFDRHPAFSGAGASGSLSNRAKLRPAL